MNWKQYMYFFFNQNDFQNDNSVNWVDRKYLYRQSQHSNTWDCKCLTLIAQMVRAFGMNPKVVGSSPPQVETFLSQKLWYFHKNVRYCVENECCNRRTVNISNVNFN